jgi:hypothetical protein
MISPKPKRPDLQPQPIAIQQRFLPDEPLLQVTPEDPITYRHLFEGTIITGGSGSGKTTGPGAALSEALLRRAGILVLCAKPGEAEMWVNRATIAGRAADVRRFSVDQPYRLNLLDYAFRQPGADRGGSDPQNVVALLLQLQETKTGQGSAGGGDAAFWISSSRQVKTSAVSILGVAGEPITFDAMNAVIDSAPYSPEDVTSPKWQSSSYFNSLLDRVAAREPKLTAIQRNDARVAMEFFVNRFARLDPRTRSGILAQIQSIIWPFLCGPAAEVCGTTTNLTPEDIFRGRIVILDLPIKLYHESGLLILTCWKLLFQRAAEARDLSRYPLPVCLWADEAQHFITSYDSVFQATARSSRIATVYLTQNLDSLRARFPGPSGDAEVQSLISNLANRILCANDHTATNKYASDAIGHEWRTQMNSSASITNAGSMTAGGGTSDSRRYRLEPSEFLKLRRGGPPDGVVDAIMFRSGTPFKATNTNYLRLTFRQG